MKVTVNDVFNSAKELKRYENYARKHIRDLPVQEIDDKLQEIQKTMSTMFSDFMKTDVSSLSGNSRVAMEDLAERQESLDNWRVRLADAEETFAKGYDPDNWGFDNEYDFIEYYNERIEGYKEYIRNCETRIAELNEALNA